MVNAAREPSGSGLAAPFDIPPIEEHLRALATSSDLPEAALRSCVARIQQARPALLAIIDAAADDAEMGDEEAYLLFRGLYVLGAARDTAAFKPLLRLLHVSPDTLDDLLGDATTTDLVRIAASVFDGDVDALLDATTDLSIDEFARHSLLQAATFLTWDGRISHDRMRGFVRRVAEEKLLPPEDTAWHAWADTISRLGWRELAPLVEQAFACGDFPVHVMEYSDFEEDLAKTEGAPADGSRFEDDGLGYLGDVVEALAWTRPQDASTERPGRSLPDAWRDVDVPYVNPMRNVGRNDPCPCGSGKKAKKCCLAD